MIVFRNVSKSFRIGRKRKLILDNISFELPADRNIAILGRNGAGKSTLISLMAGSLGPDKGSVTVTGRTSWTLAYGGAFHPLLSGRQNARFVARIFEADVGRLVAEVENFAELGDAFDLPLRTYSQGMRARLAFAVSMAVSFDRYLVDEIIGVGDARFREKCREAFRNKLRHAQVIMATHSEAGLREYCDAALLIENGSVRFFASLEDALSVYADLMMVAPSGAKVS